jgi:hypothetical protein
MLALKARIERIKAKLLAVPPEKPGRTHVDFQAMLVDAGNLSRDVSKKSDD